MASSLSPLIIDHREAATREIAKGLELTTRLRSLLSTTADSQRDSQMESLSQEIMQVLVAALSILMPARPPPVVDRDAGGLEISLACPGGGGGIGEESKVVVVDDTVSSGSEEVVITHKQQDSKKRTHLHSGTMISYEHSSEDSQWKIDKVEKKVPKTSSTKLPRNHHLHSWTTTTLSPFNDGHQWRKYGEKKICGTKMPRCYYRCTYKDDQGCNATKHVQQKDNDDPPMFVVTYKQQHSCRNRALPISLHPIVVDSPPPAPDPCHLRL